jgi:DNA/RNA endonuclease YhcR with UshA esterase domain
MNPSTFKFQSTTPLNLSFTITILGILTLLIISNTIQPKTQQINQLTIKQLDQQVKIQGQITNIRTINPSFHILTIKDSKNSTSTIQATINKLPKSTINSKTNFFKNQNITLTGTLTQYKDKLQIQTNKIKII